MDKAFFRKSNPYIRVCAWRIIMMVYSEAWVKNCGTILCVFVLGGDQRKREQSGEWDATRNVVEVLFNLSDKSYILKV